ncbi:MAG: ABC transporter ATP-binding protein/permease [Spirochaetales bacterium]|jgi:ATP-binding cassette subfamily B protein|nr:ABC transporter ATP-binding protein/permease [Spirochaetales bacterium]
MFKIVKRIFSTAGSFKTNLKLSFVYSVLHSLFEALPIWGVVYLFSRLDRINAGVMLVCFGIMAVSVAGRAFAKYRLQDKQSGTGYKIYAEKRILIGNKLKRAPLGYFNEKSLGEITAALTTTLSDLEMFSIQVLDSILSGVTYVVILGAALSFFNPFIGLITFAGLLLALLVQNAMLRVGAKLAPRRQAAQNGMITEALEYIRGMGVVKAFGLGQGNQDRVNASFEESRAANMAIERGSIKLMALYQGIFRLASSAIMVSAPYLFLGGRLDLPSCVMLLVATFTIFAPMETMGMYAALVRFVDASLDQVQEVENVPLLDEKSKEVSFDRFDIEFKNVSFGYGRREVIHNVSFAIPQGSATAIVGPSGGGKTTLCRLIARFWDVDSGQVLVGGIDVRDITCDSLLKNMSMVFQQVYLFNDSVAANIRFGKPGASMEEIIEAAKKAWCHDFIAALPGGYDTVVGEGGSSLSGGEKQRISIARAILKDAPIVILDEATASLDPENEYYIKQALDELTRNKTLIIIAHRLSTVRQADQILALDKGSIVQRGKHADLLREEGLYRRFVEIRRKSAGWQLG